MRRVVVTGMGICSPIGNDLATVTQNLRDGVSGIERDPSFAEYGFASPNKGLVKNLVMPVVPRSTESRYGDGMQLRYAVYAAHHAIADAKLTEEELFASGVVYGQGGGSTLDTYKVGRLTEEKKKPATGGRANAVTSTMASGGAAEIATQYKNGAVNYMVSAACATGNFAIGLGARHILLGDADIMLAGSGDSTDWVMSAPFDVMKAMNRNKDIDPKRASRPFDEDHSGFVMGEGAGVMVLEERQHAIERGANIYAEVVGFGFSSDGKGDPTSPDCDGAMRSMQKALVGFDGKPIDLHRVGYVKTHGTSTKLGDANELNAIARVFANSRRMPRIGSTKSLTGHALGGAGAIESIFATLMLSHNFLAPSINIDNPMAIAKELGLVDALLREGVADTDLDVVLCNSFGFGGTNASLAFSWHGPRGL